MTHPWNDPRVVDGLERQLSERRRMLDAGASSIGWKVGFGAPGALRLLDISAPLMGFLTDRTVLEPGATVDVSAWTRGIVEFEVTLYLGEDVGAGAGEAEAAAAVASLGPAIELANVDLPITADGVTEIVAGDIFHEAVVFGNRDPDRAGVDLSGLVGRVLVDGEQRAAVEHLEEITGSYPWIVATVADTLASRGERLRAGDAIITGSIVPPIPVTEGTTFTFALDPIDTISVRLST